MGYNIISGVLILVHVGRDMREPQACGMWRVLVGVLPISWLEYQDLPRKNVLTAQRTVRCSVHMPCERFDTHRIHFTRCADVSFEVSIPTILISNLFRTYAIAHATGSCA